MKARTTGSIIAVILAACAAFALVGLRSVSSEAVYPVERAWMVVSRRIWPSVTGCFSGGAAAAENAALRREIAELRMVRGDAARLESENAKLRRALEYVARTPEKWIAASVLSRGGGAAVRNILRVDKGSLAGVRVGAVVAVPEGLVGRVTEVSSHVSEITLITDPSVRVACEIRAGNSVRAYGIAAGGGDDLLVIRHLRGAAGVPARSKVLTSGRGGVFPPGLEVGTLLEVRKDERGFASEGGVLPQVDCSTLEDVFIRCEK